MNCNQSHHCDAKSTTACCSLYPQPAVVKAPTSSESYWLPSLHIRPLGAGRKSKGEEDKSSRQHYTSGSRWHPGRKSWERKSGGRKGQRGGKRKYTKYPIALSHDFIKNWVFSKSSQDLFPQGEKKSTFSLFFWLEAGANPADIYTRAQPCMRTGWPASRGSWSWESGVPRPRCDTRGRRMGLRWPDTACCSNSLRWPAGTREVEWAFTILRLSLASASSAIST